MRHAWMRGVVRCLLVAAAVTSCGGADGAKTAAARDSSSLAAASRGSALSPAARALQLQLPQMQLARVLANGAAGGFVVPVRVIFTGSAPADSAVDVRRLDPSCGTAFVDTLVAHRGDAVIGALVWVEGDVPVVPAAAGAERRPVVRLDGCRLQPRVQIAAPGSSVQLLMADRRVDSLVVVPAAAGARIDTITFITDGQLVPLARETRPGVIGIQAAAPPRTRAYVAIAPAGTAAISDAEGRASFMLAAQGRIATIRAWHPVLGLASATVTPSSRQGGSVVTLTYRR